MLSSIYSFKKHPQGLCCVEPQGQKSTPMGVRGRRDQGLSEWTSLVQKGATEGPRQPGGVGSPQATQRFYGPRGPPPTRASTEPPRRCKLVP